MTISLIKGQKADLTKNNPNLNNVIVGMGWLNANSSLEVDFSAFLLAQNSKVTKDEDLIFYGNPTGPNQSITVLSNNKQVYSGVADQAQLAVSLKNVPPHYERIAFALTIYDGEKRGQNFSQLDDTYIRIVDPANGLEIIRFNIGKSFTVETAIIVGELYKYNGEWKFNALGSGYSGGLAALCGSFGIEVKDSPSNQPSPAPTPTPAPAPTPATPPPAPTPAPSPAQPPSLSKIELKKRGDVINLEKKSGELGEILVNLNWNQRKQKGFFGSKGVDLDLGCLFELKDGRKSVIQALGESFGSLNRLPYIALDGDDRTGDVATGENLRINGRYVSEIEKVLVFAFIYEGVTNWSEADGVVTIKQQGGPDIVVRLDEHNNRKGMCAIAMIRNVNNQTFSVERIVEYFSGHLELDRAFNWGMRWTQGSK
ncbi:tellurium resistance protein TerA [Paenibacillus oralis]|uniref:Tellurium resistance protein TerA n=1 Tax=Paenibacillus oralis TaxID=2490856 RepID=A0A3P3U128_9BACL|nr:TerD family protein [Paenibacillus oralis]RRJ63288.1 tellurium resistance protein TerA [Paenibacillus oralis]